MTVRKLDANAFAVRVIKRWIIGFILAGAVCFVAVSAVNRYQRNRLEKPASAQIQAAFPDNTRDIFEHSDRFMLLSIDPHSRSRIIKDKPIFHHYAILGQTEIKDKNVQERIRAVYDDAIIPRGFHSVCFNPRHAIRAVKNGKTLDIIICFHCGGAHVYLNNKMVTQIVFNSSHQPDFDAILTNANVLLAQ